MEEIDPGRFFEGEPRPVVNSRDRVYGRLARISEEFRAQNSSVSTQECITALKEIRGVLDQIPEGDLEKRAGELEQEFTGKLEALKNNLK